MKVKELLELSREEVEQKLKERVHELFNLRFQHATGQLENTARIPMMKKDIARLKTVLRKRELESQNE
ncbi:MAG: 50S ribosomal protein L29 [Desulfatibacillaceae bacterium]